MSIYLLHPAKGLALKSSSVSPQSPRHANNQPDIRKKQIIDTLIGNSTTVKIAV
jgi:hypothetical protein